MVFFIVSILSFVWRTGSVLDPEERPPLSAREALAPRIIITSLFCIGMVYFVMIVRTLKGYGGPTTSLRRPAASKPEVEGAEERRGRRKDRVPSTRRRREEAAERGNHDQPPSSWDVGLGLHIMPALDADLEKGPVDEVIPDP